MNRGRLIRSLALGGGGGALAHGIALSEERLRVLKPILQQRTAQLQAVRDFEIDDAIEPTNGCL